MSERNDSPAGVPCWVDTLQRDVHDGHVEHDHELHGAEEGEGQPLATR